MRSLIDIMDLTVEEIDGLVETAKDIMANPDKYADACHRKNGVGRDFGGNGAVTGPCNRNCTGN